MPRSIVRPAPNGLEIFVLFIDALSSSSVFASIGMGPSTFSRFFIKIDIPPLRVRKPPVIEISRLKPFLRSPSPRQNVMCEGSKPALSVEKRSYRNLRLPRHFQGQFTHLRILDQKGNSIYLDTGFIIWAGPVPPGEQNLIIFTQLMCLRQPGEHDIMSSTVP